MLITKRIYPEAIQHLRHECEVEYVDHDEGLTAEELREGARGKTAIICQLTDRFDAETIEGLDESVRVLANVAVGYDNIDVPAATRRGILVTNTPDVLTETTADLAWALMLAAARRIVEAHQFVHEGKWRRWTIDLLVGHDVYSRTLGIVGMGRIGQAVARRAQGFGMHVFYWQPRQLPEETERELNARYLPLHELLRRADFLSVHAPLNEKTRHLIGPAEFAQMKHNAILVNTARGAVVDEDALADALAHRRIAGAGLDVFAHEPRVHPLLLQLPNVVVAPHIGSASIDTRRRMSEMAVDNVLAALRGRRPPNLVNPDVIRPASAP